MGRLGLVRHTPWEVRLITAVIILAMTIITAAAVVLCGMMLAVLLTMH
jgi:hypothetical protein